jgi:hypothetical protein
MTPERVLLTTSERGLERSHLTRQADLEIADFPDET